MSIIRIVSIALIGFAALCWLGAAYVGITNSGGPDTPAETVRLLEMFTGATSSSALLAIALSLVFKD